MRYKVFVLSAVLFAASCGSAGAQSLFDLFGLRPSQSQSQTGGQTGKNPQTPVAVKPAVQKIEARELKSTWQYAGAAVEFTGTDILSVLGGSVAAPHIKQSLEAFYARMGVAAGSCTIEFKDRDVVSARTATHSITGTYKFDDKAQTLDVSYDHPELGGKKTLAGKLAFADGRLTMTFAAADIVAIIKEQTKDMEIDQNVRDLIELISSYPGLYLGIVLQK